MARSKLRPDLLVAATCLLLGGAGLTAAGVTRLASLHQSFGEADFIYGVTDATTQLWVRELGNDAGADTDEAARRIALRLSSLPVAQRHSTALALGQAPFWTEAIPDFVQRTRMMAAAEEAVVAHVSRAPMQGDMWYLAAQLRAMTAGFDETAERYLVMSQIYAPKEVKLAAARLELAVRQGKRLSDRFREVARQDYEVVLAAYPDLAQSMAEALAEGRVAQ